MVGMVWALKLYAVVGETADTERTSLNDVAHNLRPQIFACRGGVLFGGIGSKWPRFRRVQKFGQASEELSRKVFEVRR